MYSKPSSSPWHDKDVNRQTGEFKKSHKHGALFFDSLKSYSQVSELLTEKLNTPSHVEIVMSPKGMYDYFIHAENPEKTPYDIEDIESGCGFELDKLLSILQISPNTLKSWEKTGLKRLEPPIEGTRTVYYKMEDVLNYLTP